MKKITNLLFFALLIGTLSECKKGEDDPFISLRRRKARVVGDWKLTSGTSTSTNNSTNSTETETYTYTENSFVYADNYTSGGSTNVINDAGVYSLKIEFKKDGTFTWTELKDTYISTVSGDWNFTHGVGEYKNKEQVLLTIKSIISQGSSAIYTGNSYVYTMTIKELRNKKMVIVMDETSTGTNSTSSDKSEMTLEQ
jgi:hypothetical protein